MLKFLKCDHVQIVFHTTVTKSLVLLVVLNVSCMIILLLFMQQTPKLCMSNADLNAVAQEMMLAHSH